TSYVAKASAASQGNREEAAFKLAGHVASFQTDRSNLRLTEGHILDLLRTWNHRNSPPLDDGELRHAVNKGMTSGTPRTPHVVETAPRSKQNESSVNVTKRINLVSLSTVTPEKLRWLWPARFPLGKLSLLVGDPS